MRKFCGPQSVSKTMSSFRGSPPSTGKAHTRRSDFVSSAAANTYLPSLVQTPACGDGTRVVPSKQDPSLVLRLWERPQVPIAFVAHIDREGQTVSAWGNR